MSPARDVTPDGNAPAVWAAAIAAAPVLDPVGLVAGARPILLLVSAHPDDETIGAGRLASWWSRHVGAVAAVVATAGEACYDHVFARPAGLAERRLGEWRAALGELGARPYGCLGLGDGALADSTAALTAGVSAVLHELDGPVLLAVPWRHDPHPDHAACGSAVLALAADRGYPVVQYPVWMTYRSDPEALTSPRTTLRRVVVDATADAAQARACRHFVSQLQPAAPGLGAVVPPAMVALHDRQLLIIEGDR